MSKFGFIKHKVLQENLDVTFKHILDLISSLDDRKYNKLSRSSFRKTIIIHTASIVEALLFYLLKESFSEKDLEKSEWRFEYNKKNELFQVNKNHKIVAGNYKEIRKNIDFKKLNLGQINDLLYEKKIISKTIYKKVDKVRDLRNDQHLSRHKIIKDYSKKDIEFVFSVAKEVKDIFK